MLLISIFASYSLSLAQEVVPITVRCKANVSGGEGGRCDNFTAVEAEVEQSLGVDIVLTLIEDDKDWGEYKNEFVLASEAGQAPDIIVSGHEDIGAWAPAGYIIPLDDMVAGQAQFADVVQNLWKSMSWDGKTWGVPKMPKLARFSSQSFC